MFAEHDTLKGVFKPFNSLFLSYAVVKSDGTWSSSSLGNTTSRAGKNDVEIHTVNSYAWIVFDTQIDVFVNTETKVSRRGEIGIFKFEFFDFQTTFQNFRSFLTTNSAVDCNLFISTNVEGTNSVAGLKERGNGSI